MREEWWGEERCRHLLQHRCGELSGVRVEIWMRQVWTFDLASEAVWGWLRWMIEVLHALRPHRLLQY